MPPSKSSFSIDYHKQFEWLAMVFYVHGRILDGHTTRFYFGGTHANIDTLSKNLDYIFGEEEYFKVEVQNIKLMIL
jgi:hypothetical protein